MSKSKRLLPVAGAAVLLALAAAAFLVFRRPGRPDFGRLRGGRDFNVILITVDTLRADRIACYGFSKGIRTPTMDLFASRGVKFDRCMSQTPLTFPSHTTIMTGTLPPFHGVRDNGGFVVPSGLTTMAEAFKAKGYSTGAFVGAYVLDSKWGLDQGFDRYEDRFDLSRFERVSLGSVQRPANEVMDLALPWLDRVKSGKFFAWIHLYDPHTPYEPPPPFDKEYAPHPYLGEIAFADSQLGRLWDWLKANNLTDNLFLVFASDHGESLGEHEESAHGFFVYQATLHVPLIVVTPFSRLQGKSVGRVVSLADIMPTVCDMAGLPVPPQVQGEDLVPLMARPQAAGGRLSYAESFYPRFHYGWSELRSVQDERFKLILAPVPELYDLAADPRETKNLVYLRKDVFDAMSARAAAFEETAAKDAFASDLTTVDEETREKLAALGYIGSFMDPKKLAGRRLANPRDKIGVFNRISAARENGLAGNADQALETLRQITADDPDIGDAWFSMGNILFKARRFPEAVDAFKKALDLKPDDTFAAMNIANAYVTEGNFAESERFLLDYIKRGFTDPQLYFMLGNMNLRRKDYARAASWFEECLAKNADSAGSHNALAAIDILRGDMDGADEHLGKAIALNPRLPGVYFNQAQVLEERGRLDEAEAAYRKELEDSPRHFKSMFNLARLCRKQGRDDDEKAWLDRTVEANPDFPLSYFYLARILLNRGGGYDEAIRLAKKGLELKPDVPDKPLGYFLLADLYNRTGDAARSEANARLGLKAQADAEAASRK